MQLDIVPFLPEHLDAASSLLAARYRIERAHVPKLPPHFEEVVATRDILQKALMLPAMHGVAAVLEGQTIGYLLGTLVFTPPLSLEALIVAPRAGIIPYEGHAARQDVYPAMYASVAQSWVQAGCFTHYLQTVTSDHHTLQSWFSLGFGQEQIRAVRDIRSLRRPPKAKRNESVVIRRAGPNDIDIVARMLEDLVSYHAGPPIFLPFPPECQVVLRESTDRALLDSSAACWIAFVSHKPVGIVVMVPPRMGMPMTTPERSIFLQSLFTLPAARGSGVGSALLDEALSWATVYGYESCVLEWMSANQAAGKFWRAHGFHPMSYRLCRRVDQRIVWARGQLDGPDG
jgi:GNAT superfamily N-acetyltransferase